MNGIVYEACEKKLADSDRPSDWTIVVAGAGKGSGKVATVHGRYGVDAEGVARRIVIMLNGQPAG